MRSRSRPSQANLPRRSSAASSDLASRTKAVRGDLAAAAFGVSVLVDAFSADFVRGAVVDFSEALTGGGFKISNPNAAQSCGCGKSFATERQGKAETLKS